MSDVKGIYVGGTPINFKDETSRNLISDVYDTTKQYEIGDYCINNNKLYIATIRPAVGGFDGSCWKETTMSAEVSEQNKNFSNLGKKTLLLTAKSLSDTKLSEPITNFRAVRIYVTVNGQHTGTMEFDVEDIVYASDGYQWQYAYDEGNSSTYSARFRFSFADANNIVSNMLSMTGWTSIEAKIYGIK